MSILGLIFYSQMRSEEYAPADNEIALHIQLDTKEDIGLLVYDYRADGQEYSGGTSNADRSLIKHDSDVFVVWSQEELDTTSDEVKLSIQFRIITEYVNPNYENVYPESITKYANPLSLEARFGLTVFAVKAALFGIKAACGIAKALLLVLGFPVMLIALLIIGLAYLAIPLLIVALLAAFVAPRVVEK